MSREDFYRLKKVLDNKKKAIEAEAIETEKKIAYCKAKGIACDEAGNILDNVKDDDLIFAWLTVFLTLIYFLWFNYGLIK